MSRRRSRRPAVTPRRRPWLAAVPILAVVLLAGWWFFGRAAAPITSTTGATGAGAVLASYRPPDLHALAVSPTDPRTVVFGSHRGVLVSHDAGATWSMLSGGNGDAMGLALATGSARAYAAGHDVFFRSDDGGRTWASLRPALPGTDIHGFAASPSTPGAVYAYVVGFGLFRSPDGTTWSRSGDASGGTMSLAAAKGAAGDVLLATTMQGVERSRDAGATWERVPQLGSAYVSAVGDRAYAVSGSAVYLSADGGLTWTTRPFPRGGGALIAGAATDAQLVYVVTDRLEVWRSRDAGTTWERAG